MMRYVLAGLAMTASVVLLFLASFGAPVPGVSRPNEPTRAAQVAGAEPDGSEPSRMADSRDTTEIMAALQEQIRRAAQTLASLETQVTQTRQEIASLQAQRTTAAPAVTSTRSGQESASSQAEQAGVLPSTLQAPPSVQAPPPVQGSPTVQASPQLRPSTSPASQPSRVQAPPPDTRIARVNPPDTRAGDDDATQAALGKLRRQSAQGPASQGFAGPIRVEGQGEPHRVPTIERLADARAAVIEGRMEDARRYLQAAQVQLVFRAVGPSEEQPRVSQATGPISQALLALSTGDRGRAIIAIDQASGALDTSARSRQFGSLPSEDGAFLPPVPRVGP